MAQSIYFIILFQILILYIDILLIISFKYMYIRLYYDVIISNDRFAAWFLS
jgi:hypothetical protein